MPPSMLLADERRTVCRYQIPFVSQSLGKADSRLLSPSKRQQITKRKSLSDELDRRRKVRFSSIRTALLEDVPQASDMLEEEKILLWWSRAELNETYETIATLMRSFARRPRNDNGTQPYQGLLSRIDESCKTAFYEQEQDLNSEDLNSLATWHRNSVSKRGLEKLFLNSQERDVRVRATIIHAAMSILQNTNIDDAIKAESIRGCSERLTKPARMFARVLGEADAASALPVPTRRRTRRATGPLQ